MVSKKQLIKTKILDAAEELILESSIEDMTIAKIAQKAGIADSLAYRYFKGKEDIVFSIVAERTKEEIALLKQQLQGIIDPLSKLSKMIWYMLKYNDSHRNHVRNLLFRCRSNKEFYISEAYRSIKEYEFILQEILKQGTEEGVFCGDIDIKLIKQMILGTVDIEALSCVVTGEIEESSSDFNDIMYLLIPILTKNKNINFTDKSQAIMHAATKMFAKKGFANTTIANIAEMAGVAEGTIYDYFGSKEELLFAISDTNLNGYLNNVSNIFKDKAILTPVEKLWRLMRSFTLNFLTIQDFMTIYFMDTLFNNRYYQTNIQKKQSDFPKMLDKVIEDGKKDGSFRKDVNPRIFWYMLIGSYAHLALRWIIIEHREFDKYAEVRRLMTSLMNAVLPEPLDLGYLFRIEL